MSTLSLVEEFSGVWLLPVGRGYCHLPGCGRMEETDLEWELGFQHKHAFKTSRGAVKGVLDRGDWTSEERSKLER